MLNTTWDIWFPPSPAETHSENLHIASLGSFFSVWETGLLKPDYETTKGPPEKTNVKEQTSGQWLLLATPLES